MGLDVHDTSNVGPVPKGPLAAGHVVTVEPGAYLIPLLLAKARADPRVAQMIDFDVAERLMTRDGLGGVRIEDNVAMLALPLAPGAAGAAAAGQAGAAAAASAPLVLFNLTGAAGVPSDVQDVESVMRQEWQPLAAMSMSTDC